MTREQLLPMELIERLPTLNATEHDRDPVVQATFFFPCFRWTWYAIEFDGDDLFFGLVDGDTRELGYFRLSELMVNRDRLGLPIERDEYFTPKPLSALLRSIEPFRPKPTEGSPTAGLRLTPMRARMLAAIKAMKKRRDEPSPLSD